MDMRDEIRKLQELMEAADYVTDAPIATSVHLAMRLRKPLLIEGPAGVGKTEVAKVVARMLGTNLIRLQCYEGLRRRCLYLWIDYPSAEKETRIIARKVPGINARLSREIAKFMETLRQVRLAKVPGVAETLDWAQALAALHADHLDEPVLTETLGCLLKDADDMKRFRAEVAKAGLGSFIPART